MGVVVKTVLISILICFSLLGCGPDQDQLAQNKAMNMITQLQQWGLMRNMSPAEYEYYKKWLANELKKPL